MNWLAMVFALELGITTMDYHFIQGPDSVWIEDLPISGYTVVEAGFVICGALEISGSVDTVFIGNDRFGFAPYWTEYSFRCEGRYKNAAFGIRHSCIHMVDSCVPDLLAEAASESRVYLRLNSR